MKIIALLLCFVLVVVQINAVPKDPPPPSEIHMLAICLIGAASAIGGWVYFKVKSCTTKYYCVKDEDGNKFVSNASRSERALNDWTVISGPYRSAAECAANCNTNSQQVVVNIPLVPIRIMQSSNLVDWTVAATIYDDPEHFTWDATNSASAPAMFYQVR